MKERIEAIRGNLFGSCRRTKKEKKKKKKQVRIGGQTEIFTLEVVVRGRAPVAQGGPSLAIHWQAVESLDHPNQPACGQPAKLPTLSKRRGGHVGGPVADCVPAT